MSISGISSSTTNYRNQFQEIMKDFSALKTDLSSGNLTTAQQAYTTLTQDLQNVQQTEGIQQTSGGSQISTDLAAVGKALQSGDLKTAQSAFATLTQDLQSAAQTQGTQQTYGHHHHHHHGGSSQTASTSSQGTSTSSQTASTTFNTDLAAVGSAWQSGTPRNCAERLCHAHAGPGKQRDRNLRQRRSLPGSWLQHQYFRLRPIAVEGVFWGAGHYLSKCFFMDGLRFKIAWLCIWHTRASVTPRVLAISFMFISS